MGVSVDPVIKQHAVVAERAIRTVKERVRGVLFGRNFFPYEIDNLMLRHVVLWVSFSRNILPTSNQPGTSPMELFLGRKVQIPKLKCGDYIYFCDDTDNNVLHPRITEAIALSPTNSLDGAWSDLVTVLSVLRSSTLHAPSNELVGDNAIASVILGCRTLLSVSSQKYM
jgi:hypothetical protein